MLVSRVSREEEQFVRILSSDYRYYKSMMIARIKHADFFSITMDSLRLNLKDLKNCLTSVGKLMDGGTSASAASTHIIR
jgi:hypothetical protein